jgi:uncharacterized protein (TIGR00661 family)
MQRHADYFIHGRGRGHASRGPAILEALSQEGYRVRVHAGGDALDLLGEHGGQTGEVETRAPLLPGPFAPLKLLGRSVVDAWNYGRERPDVVISDGDQAALLASRVAAVPSVAVGHDLVFCGRVRLPPLPGAALQYQRLSSVPVRAARRWVAVHFLPAVSLDPALQLARPDTWDAELATETSDEVLCYFRDKNGNGVVQLLREAGCRVSWFGGEAAAAEGVAASPIGERGFRGAFARARAVVGSAGSNLLAECVMAGKPVLALYRDKDSEQRLNATLIEQAGVGMGACFDDLNAKLVAQFIERCRRQDFARVDLKKALPPVSVAVRRALVDLDLGSVGEAAFA